MTHQLTESQLREIIQSAVHEELQNEGWLKNLAAAGVITAAAMNPTNANAQQTYNYKTPDNIRYQYSTNKRDSIAADKSCDKDDYVTNHPFTEKQLAKLFPQAYKDRNANPEVWKQNQNAYVAQVYGRYALGAKIAASHGQNPWQALLDRYTSRNYQNKMKQQAEREKAENDIFTLSGFDL